MSTTIIINQSISIPGIMDEVRAQALEIKALWSRASLIEFEENNREYTRKLEAKEEKEARARKLEAALKIVERERKLNLCVSST